ncbi:bifunctional [glutamate--ammonia ligase]-adenylyl-L-tyrosine phosphorylase/[glutamate--ammonia-ligase] adenylyltransferase [uncultured Salinisphaera sp.]|uniref:bifunctional [glutamate--ammonia ligase]-adenylyl-L-tyrosine phosphorylase/[glutamate--ammonia-ligase] adenylyltransferase n=1 Tax=uncultured Salinisphaera sp. TaxID=359372 RepID=UPI0032B2025D
MAGPEYSIDDLQAPGVQCSRFLTDWLSTHPLESSQLVADQAFSREHLDLRPAPPDTDDPSEQAATLRRYRDRWLSVIAWRDLMGVDSLEATLGALSDLADDCIEAALCAAERSLAPRLAAPMDPQGRPARLVIIGMGKLGGRELNFSSDIDLIFAYRDDLSIPDDADTDVSSYFRKIAQKTVQLLSETTADGFVYRVDTRLRPFGDSGALVASLSAMESYYQNHGREWERYAWVKARPVAGDIEAGQALIRMVRPFVYRRYLDYGTFESIREMKAMIDAQVVRSDAANNIKLGLGGIREIEFVAQAFQLIRGGQEPNLQTTSLRITLSRLAEAGHLLPDTAETLDADYVTLRRLENRLQMVDDQQTHDLPDDEVARERIARAMGYNTLSAFDADIAALRQRVHRIFDEVFVDPETDDAAAAQSADDKALARLWSGALEVDTARGTLERIGLTQVDEIIGALDDLREQRLYRVLSDRSRRWVARLIPLLLSQPVDSVDRDRAIVRTLTVIEAIIGRSNYIALLVEHPAALKTLTRLCGASNWITTHIAGQPALLDTLLDRRQLYQPPSRDELAASLASEQAAIAASDLEAQMNALRRFQKSAVLRVAAADVTDAMPLMIVSDKLTEIAEVVLAAALDIAWARMRERFGEPRADDGGMCGFTIVAYGKLGGLELGYASDLDLVFIYDGPTERETVSGQRSLTHQVFFTRLAQRLIHVLSTQTMAGRAYEIDMRLRPSGNAGLMVSHIDALADYQRNKAWTWEHQALVRARPVAGNTALAHAFEWLRQDILARPRELPELAGEVRAMRTRMRDYKDESTADELDVKQMAGGLIDIEFLAQFAALAYGQRFNEIVRFTDAIRILESMESAEIWALDDVQCLTRAYRDYRRIAHGAALQEQRAMIDIETAPPARARIAELWHQWIDAAAESSESHA